MRTIKFRALRDDMSDCNFYYGQLVYRVNEMTGKQYPAITNDGIYFTSCIEGTESQFTGLHDKNGKEIYEGDVCKWSSWFLGSYQEINGDKIISLVEWSNKKGKWFVKNDIWDLGIYSDIEVIGNIYENPELLNNI